MSFKIDIVNICPVCNIAFKKLDYAHLSKHPIEEFEKYNASGDNRLPEEQIKEWDGLLSEIEASHYLRRH